jgi:hypothetical protein
VFTEKQEIKKEEQFDSDKRRDYDAHIQINCLLNIPMTQERGR